MTLNKDGNAKVGPLASQPRKFVIHAGTSQFLDLSRWLAAFLVVFSHVRSIILANYADIVVHPTIVTKALYFMAAFGHQSVVVFFVISGYLVGGRAFLRATAGQFSLIDYAIHRFVRIYIVLVPALFIGLVFDLIGSKFVDNLGLYTHRTMFHWWMIDFSISDRLDLETFLGNLMLLQTILVDPLGSNGPLWSLANEWWYYVAFGLGLGIFIVRSKILRFLCCCGLFVFAVIFPIGITSGCLLWLVGLCVAFLDQRWWGWPVPVGLAIFVTVVVTVSVLGHFTAVTGSIWDFGSDLGVAVAFSIALLCAKRGRWLLRGLNPWLASFSYTTYLVHAPAMVLIVATSHRFFGIDIGEQPNTASIALMALIITVLYGYAWVFSFFTERHTDVARAWISHILRTRIQTTQFSGIIIANVTVNPTSERPKESPK